MVLTFFGQVHPDKVYCFNMSHPVETYQLSIIQRRNCCRYGHISKDCHSKPHCCKYPENRTSDSCEIAASDISCFLCQGKHKATEVKCPEHLRQKSIKIVLSQNISYSEASKRFRHIRHPYSDSIRPAQTPQTFRSYYYSPKKYLRFTNISLFL